MKLAVAIVSGAALLVVLVFVMGMGRDGWDWGQFAFVATFTALVLGVLLAFAWAVSS